MNKLIAFHGKQEVKDLYLKRLQDHAAADEIIQGVTWERGKGCAVGCTLHTYSHKAYETELGIPMILAKLEDRIFEGMSAEDSKLFPVRFLSSIAVGADLSNVFKEFFVWMLTDPIDGVINFTKKEETKKIIQDVSDLIKKSLLEEVKPEQFLALRRIAAAYAAAAAADAYAAAAAYAAADAYAAAAAAAADADAAAYADAAADGRRLHFKKMGDKLIELMAAAPVLEVVQ